MSLPPGFKKTQTTEEWRAEHVGHEVNEVERNFPYDDGSGAATQKWLVCETCKTAHLYSVDHRCFG